MASHNKTTRKLLLAGLSVAVLLVAASYITVRMTHSDGAAVDTGDQTAYNNSKKAAVVDNGGVPVDDNTAAGGKGSAPSDAYTPPASNSGIVITPSTENGNVILTTKLTGYSSGSCTVTASNGSETTTQTAQVIFAPDYSICAGFSVPISTLGGGNWDITLSVTSGGNTNSKSITYGVSP